MMHVVNDQYIICIIADHLLSSQPSGLYVAKVDNPATGWRAFFLQVWVKLTLYCTDIFYTGDIPWST